MLDSVQILLTVVISVLTVLLTFIGVEVYRILKEVRGSIKRVNQILDDAHKMTSSIAGPMEGISELVVELKKGLGFFNKISQFFKKHSSKEEETGEDLTEEELEEEIEPAEEQNQQQKKRRFFTRRGRDLKTS